LRVESRGNTTSGITCPLSVVVDMGYIRRE
jgi:hypothetical protein